MWKKIGKKISKNSGSKYSQKLFDHAKQSATDALKFVTKRRNQKQQKQLVIWLVIKFVIKLQEPQKPHHRVIQLLMKKKCLY